MRAIVVWGVAAMASDAWPKQRAKCTDVPVHRLQSVLDRWLQQQPHSDLKRLVAHQSTLPGNALLLPLILELAGLCPTGRVSGRVMCAAAMGVHGSRKCLTDSPGSGNSLSNSAEACGAAIRQHLAKWRKMALDTGLRSPLLNYVRCAVYLFTQQHAEHMCTQTVIVYVYIHIQ